MTKFIETTKIKPIILDETGQRIAEAIETIKTDPNIEIDKIKDLEPEDYFLLLEDNMHYINKLVYGSIFKLNKYIMYTANFFGSNTEGMYFTGEELCLKI